MSSVQQGAYSEGYEAGRIQERAEIVEMLRERVEGAGIIHRLTQGPYDEGRADSLRSALEAIEARAKEQSHE